MLVGFYNPRIFAIFYKGVMIGVIKKNYRKVSQRFYNCKVVKRNLIFSQEWELLESNLIKDIKKNRWPTLLSKANKLLKLLQTKICWLSRLSFDKMAMKLIEIYSMNIVVRYIAINKVTSQLSYTAGVRSFIIKNKIHKIALLFQDKETRLNLFLTLKIKFVQIPKYNGLYRTLSIKTIISKILETQLCLLLDPFYEAKYPEHMYGYRKGRNTCQAVGFLKETLEESNGNYSGLILLNVEKCFINTFCRAILYHFIVPSKWKPFLAKLLKTKTLSKNNSIIASFDWDIVQSSIIGPLICNVIVNKALFKTVINSSRLAIFKNFKATQYIYHKLTCKNPQWNIFKHIVVYANDIVITTTNFNEMGVIFAAVSKLFLKFGLKIVKEKSQIINYLKNKFIKLKYLGFYFVYVSTKHIKKGGILTCYDNVAKKKFSKTQNSIYLVYPSIEKLQKIKCKCKFLIKLLSKVDLVQVISKLNSIIRSLGNYYIWSNSCNRLKILDRLLLLYLKKYLIKKFRRRGIKRLVWVAKNFLVCRTSLNPISWFTSPYNFKWHPHIKLLNNKDSNKCFENVLFLIFPSKIAKVLPIKLAILFNKLRTQSYYLMDDKFSKNFANLYLKRINTNNCKKKFFI